MKAGDGSSSGPPQQKCNRSSCIILWNPFTDLFFGLSNRRMYVRRCGERISGGGLKRASGAWYQSEVFANLGKEFRLFSSRIWNNWLSTLSRNWAKKILQNLWKSKTWNKEKFVSMILSPTFFPSSTRRAPTQWLIIHHQASQEAKGGGELDKKKGFGGAEKGGNSVAMGLKRVKSVRRKGGLLIPCQHPKEIPKIGLVTKCPDLHGASLPPE